jgi:hypothetical protein
VSASGKKLSIKQRVAFIINKCIGAKPLQMIGKTQFEK